MQALSGCRELLYGFDADDRGDAGGFELAPGVAEERLHRGDVETAADLIRASDGEAFAGGGEQAAGFELFFVLFECGLDAFKRGIGLADRVGERFVRQIMKARCARQIRSLGHDLSSWLGLGPRWRSNAFGGRLLCTATFYTLKKYECKDIFYTMTKETKIAQVNLRLQPSLKAAAEKAAEDDSRSLTSLIEKLLTDHLKKKGYLKG
jgi:hypothetical protein